MGLLILWVPVVILSNLCWNLSGWVIVATSQIVGVFQDVMTNRFIRRI